MKKLIILIALITLPMVTFGQNSIHDPVKQENVIETIILQDQKENQNTLVTFSKNEVTDLSYKKSIELISIKAYRKSLQIKIKEIITC